MFRLLVLSVTAAPLLTSASRPVRRGTVSITGDFDTNLSLNNCDLSNHAQANWNGRNYCCPGVIYGNSIGQNWNNAYCCIGATPNGVTSVVDGKTQTQACSSTIMLTDASFDAKATAAESDAPAAATAITVGNSIGHGNAVTTTTTTSASSASSTTEQTTTGASSGTAPSNVVAIVTGTGSIDGTVGSNTTVTTGSLTASSSIGSVTGTSSPTSTTTGSQSSVSASSPTVQSTAAAAARVTSGPFVHAVAMVGAGLIAAVL